MVSFKLGAAAGALVVAAGLAASPLAALTMRECSAAYKSAQTSGKVGGKLDSKLGGMGWQEFRKARCGPGATPGGAAGAAPSPGPAPGGSAYLPGGAVFPLRIAPRYSDETPGKARRHTCLDQYRVNKTGNANGSLKWVQKGGGYYSECNRRLRAGKQG